MTAMFKSWHFWVTILILLAVAYYVFWNYGYQACEADNGIVSE